MNKIRVSSDRMYPYSAITPVPKGQVKFSKIQFYLSDDWNGRNTIAQFQQGEKTLNKALNSDNTCYIPSDFDIGIVTVYLKGYGLDGFSIATANGVSIPIVQGAFDGGDPAVPPEPDLYQKLIQSIQQTTGDLNNLKTEDKSSLVAAVNEVLESGGSGGGTSDHDKLIGRDKADQHPMSAITGLEDALAGKLTKETDPTVPAWAKAPTKPGYTAAEVGADPAGTAAAIVSEHNTEVTAHNDMRLLIQGLTDRLNALADSDDTTLDQLSEIVAYIKGNRELIAAITTDKVSVADIIDNLTTNVSNKPLSAAQGVALKAMIDAITIPTALPNPNALTFTGAVTGSYDGSAPLEVEIPSGGGGITVINTAAVGQTIKITAVDENGQPTEWEAVDMPGGGGHWETVLDTVWEQDVINPTDFDSETGIFTCAEGELGNLELDKKYVFYQQCVVEGVAYNTILLSDKAIVTKLSETTFSIDATPPTTFVPTNVKFSKGACIAITDIDAKKIRLTLDGQFKPTATLYDRPFYGTGLTYFGNNTGYIQIRNAYHAYQQVTVELESPFRIVGEILCGFNAPSKNASFHFKNNSFCCPFVPYDAKGVNEVKYFLTSDGTKIAKLYSTSAPWALGGLQNNTAISNDYLSIISGTRVKMERWVE